MKKIITNSIRCFFCVTAIAAVSVLGSEASAGQILAEAESRLQAIYNRHEFDANIVRAVWLRDSSGYTVLEPSPLRGERELVEYDALNGKRTVLVTPSQLIPAGTEKPLTIEDYALSPDRGLLLLQTNGRESAEDGRRIADYWTLERKSGMLREVVAGADPVPLRTSLSPDGKCFVYSLRQNLYGYDLLSAKTTPLSTDGIIGSVANGGASWSPDGRQIAYVQTDSSAVGLRPIIDHIEPTYPKVRWIRFARVGTAIPTLRVGVVSADGGATRWLPIPAEPAGFYLGPVSWAGNSEELLVEKLSRSRDARDLLLAHVRTGSVACIFHETDPAWVDASYQTNAGLEWIRKGRAFVLLSERDGWRHAYVISRDGTEQALLTPAPSDIISRGRVDERNGWFYYLASPDNATQRFLYRVQLDGSGKAERISPADQPGSHSYDFSPDARWAFHTYSTFDSPPLIELVRLPEHRVERMLEDNREIRGRLESLIPRRTEFFELEIAGGVKMDAWMIKPRDFDPKKKYPVFVFVYGEPHAQTVLDDWSGGQGHSMFHRMIADVGYLVVSIDNRGTPAPKGAAWRRAIYGSLGPLSTEEQAAGLQELGRIRPYVDLSRVGIWGWSGGGSNTLNALFRKPDLYHLGIAVAPKPQPHLYNAWFQEIFMRTLEENPEGYRKSAPLNYAEGLKGHLLIIHGTGETNTHLQITEGLVDRLVELGKRFDYMSYPNRDHGMREGKGTQVHLRMLMTRYLIEHLPPGPR